MVDKNDLKRIELKIRELEKKLDAVLNLLVEDMDDDFSEGAEIFPEDSFEGLTKLN